MQKNLLLDIIILIKTELLLLICNICLLIPNVGPTSVPIKENKYDLYKKAKRVYISLKYENKTRNIDEYLRRCVAIQLLVNKCRED